MNAYYEHMFTTSDGDSALGSEGHRATAAPPGGSWLDASGTSADGLLEHLPLQVLALECRGAVTRTFRRLDPERQLAVIGAILVEAADAGPHGPGVRAVAQRAGLSVGSLYQYFPDRRSMVGVAAEIAGGLLAADLGQYRDALAALPLREALIAYVCAGVEWSEMQGDMLRFFARAAYQGDTDLGKKIVAPVAEELLAMVGAMLEAAQSRGEIGEGADLEVAARFVHALTLALGDCGLLPHLDMYYRLLDGASIEQRAAQLADFVLAALMGDGLRPSPGEG
jgi:AcrR family transcriptional regulator